MEVKIWVNCDELNRGDWGIVGGEHAYMWERGFSLTPKEYSVYAGSGVVVRMRIDSSYRNSVTGNHEADGVILGVTFYGEEQPIAHSGGCIEARRPHGKRIWI